MRSNERSMLSGVEAVRQKCKSAAVLTIRLVHGGTVRPYGGSPGTPVDTGEARSGGRASAGTPPTWAPPGEAPSYPIMGDHEIDQIFSATQLGDSFFWGNHVPYIEFLEEGRSSQAPQGFLRLSIETAIAEVQGREF